MQGAPNLVVVSGTSRIELAADEVAVVGRDPECRIFVDRSYVSRRHAQLSALDGRWVLDDLGGSGGIWLDGVQVAHVDVDGPTSVRLAVAEGPLIDLIPVQTDGVGGADGGVHPADGWTTIGPTVVSTGIESTTIGRDPDNDVVIDDLVVSRHHAAFHTGAGGCSIVDLDSTNGTFVNGRRVNRAMIEADDVVSIGPARFRLVDGRLVELRADTSVVFGARGVVVEVGDGIRLVDQVSFDLPERCLLGIVGPSGAGKSSLLAVLGGQREAAQGQVIYQDRDLHRHGEELVKQIGLVPQADLLHGGLSVRQSLQFTEELRLSRDLTEAERDARIDEVLEQLGMTNRADSRIDRLSGGERKRVNVATELLTDPPLLLLDEPASGLDAGLERTLMRLLRGLADAGRTVLVVTHSLDSLDLCDYVLVLAPGGVPAYFGPPGDLGARFGHDDLVETFHDLATVAIDWRDPRIQRESTTPTATAPGPEAPAGSAPRRSLGEWLGQLAALSRRFVAVLAADRRNLGLLMLQAPVLGVLMLIALPAGELSFPSPTQVRFVSTAGLVLFVILLGATWLGANNAIREITRERDLFLRERTAGLSVSAYVLSKALVLGVLTAAQSMVLVAIAAANQQGPESAVLLGWPLGELMVVVALAGVASMALSLLVSAIVGSPDRATTLLPIVLILQFVLSAGGVLPEIVDKPVLRELSAVSSAQWGFAASASTADLNELQAFTDQLRDLREIDAADPAPALDALDEPAEPAARWAHEPDAWLTAMAVLLGLTVVPIAGAIAVLRRTEAQ